MYIAEAINAPIVTQGNTFEELQKNIQEATELFLRTKTLLSLGSVPRRPYSRALRSLLLRMAPRLKTLQIPQGLTLQLGSSARHVGMIY